MVGGEHSLKTLAPQLLRFGKAKGREISVLAKHIGDINVQFKILCMDFKLTLRDYFFTVNIFAFFYSCLKVWSEV